MQLQLTIEKLVSKGEGLARREGKTIFVQGALPDETVIAEETEQKSDFSRAKAIEVLTPSEDRVEPQCPHYGICGGCDLQHASVSSQATFKYEIVKENLKRMGSVDIDDPERKITVLPVVSGPGWAYRSRVRFHVDLASGACGFIGRKSSELVDIHHCPILCGSLNRLLDEKRPLLLKAAQMRLATEGWQQRKRFVEVPAFAGDTKVSLSDTAVSVKLGEKTLWANSNVFFQNNRHILPVVVGFVQKQVIGSTIVDLYAGVGTFSAFVEGPELQVVAVERDKQCLALAERNLAHTEFFPQTAERWSRLQDQRKVDTVIVDPPRTGLEARLVRTIASWEPKAIIYVSCDSVTLARDCKRFAQAGYKVSVLQVFDLYPQTSHVESAVVLIPN